MKQKKVKKLKLELKVYGALCETQTFKINNIDADYRDFGEKYDTSPEKALDYCCGNMEFIPQELQDNNILKKYKITKKQYEKICNELKDKLSFGCCGWCS